ncbi:MAG: hypothetical protein M1831_004393 [Alyxoria varia]|nr:MAG: hypothetical protein M1831_004393 [Alyxoria varia]
MDIPAAAQVLGTMGAVCWSIQLIPQIIVNYRRHHAIGLQPSMMMLWAWAGVPLGVYNIVEEFNIALRVQPQVLTVLSLITWIQCYHYQKRWHPIRSLLVISPMVCLMGGIEGALIVALRIAKARGFRWPLTVCAVFAAALLAAGVLRHYWDIYVHRHVRGISFLFVGLDAAGDLFSLVSLFFQTTIDLLGIVIYGTELALWLGIMACGVYYNLGPFLRRVLAKDGNRDGNTRVFVGNPEIEVDQSPELEQTQHEASSSTSVFRTPSSEVVVRASCTLNELATNNDFACPSNAIACPG